ncbi:MAG: hypothetical protein RL732_795 [Bacteroidota bacterium]|jgi:cell division protein ZapA
MENIITINILIGDRTYRVKIAPQDEETVRKTVKQINDKILEFKTLFAGKDMQDYIAMAILWYATQSAQPNNQGEAPEEVRESSGLKNLLRLEALLDKTLA